MRPPHLERQDEERRRQSARDGERHFWQQLKDGISIREIARREGITRRTVQRRLRRFEQRHQT